MKYFAARLLLLLVGTCQLAGAVETGETAKIAADIAYLASLECQGRGVGSKGIERAERYIAEAFKAAGLEPDGDAGTYFQRFDVTTGVALGARNELDPSRGDLTLPGKDYQPLELSRSGTATSAAVVFAGYGITAPAFHYDDYAGLDVRNKVVLVLAHEPRELDKESPFRAPEAFRFTQLRYKAINAREHGAVAILVINDSWRHPKDPDQAVPFDGSHAVSEAGILAGSLSLARAEALLGDKEKGIEESGKSIDSKLAPASRAIDLLKISLDVELNHIRGKAANVVGRLPGGDPVLARESLIIGAHHDHLGLGGISSLAPSARGKVHHGADDNASGVAGLLSLVRHFTSAAEQPRRSLRFVTFTAEEMGLLGSAFHVKNPPSPLTATHGMINLDMIGRLRENRVNVQGAGTARELRPIVASAATSRGLTVAFSGDGYGPSDHTSFFAKNRPVLFFFTGPHTDYHRPSDTADKTNAAGVARVSGLVADVLTRLDGRDKALTFVKAASPHGDGGHGGVHGSRGSGASRGYGAYFGSIPDFSEHVGGVLLSGVREGSPAALAGVQAGDAIVEFGGVTVANLRDFTFALRSHRPGDQVSLKVSREGKTLKLKAALAKRK